MPNKQYIKGVRKERKIVNEARSKGLIAFRSAGSHSPIDVVIIDHINKIIHFIQCKPDDMSNNKKQLITSTLSHLNTQYIGEFKVI